MPELNFKGKQHIYAHHMTVPYRPLLLDKKRSLLNGGGNAEDNLIINGDNLHALKSLLPRYAGRIKCIYIDPPYNTGSQAWVYNDRVNSPLMQEWLKANRPVDGEDLERHDKWLCMMWPRLQLLKELLSDDGVIFVSIDDNEVHNLRHLMDEIFGEKNFIAQFSWHSKFSPANDAKTVSRQHEHIICYAREIDELQIGMLPRTQEMDARFKNPDNDPRGDWQSISLHAKSGRESDIYTLTLPNGVKFECPTGRFPLFNREKLLELYHDNRLWFGKTGKSVPREKVFLSEVKQGKTPSSVLHFREVGSTDEGNKDLAKLVGKGMFSNPKPVRLIEHLLRLSTGTSSSNSSTPPPPPPPHVSAAASEGKSNKQVSRTSQTGETDGDIVLDSFAGSGTTAHAVLALNKEDGGNRKFILVECEDYADTITAERVRRVIRGVPNAKDAKLREGLGGSFRFYTLGKPLDMESMLAGKNLPSYSVLAAWLLHTASGLSAGEKDLKPLDKEGLFYGGGQTDYYLRYQPDVEYLREKESMLNEEMARRIGEANRRRNKKAVVFAPGKYLGQRELTKMGITFCQLPYSITGI